MYEQSQPLVAPLVAPLAPCVERMSSATSIMTKYPKQGRGRKWTIKELEAVTADWRGHTLSDGDGLSGDVRVANGGAVSIVFRYGFKWQGAKKHHYCGSWPANSLDSIRNERDRARDLVKSGVHPGDQRKAERIEAQARVEAVIAEAARIETENLPFRSMFNAWIEDGVARADGNAELRRSFEKDVLPAIGDKPVKDVTEHDLRALLRVMVKRGVHRMAARTYNDLVQLFTWAEKRKPWRILMAEGNPADLLELDKILPADSTAGDPRTRILTADEIRELRDIFEAMEVAYAETPAGKKYETSRPVKKETQLALWISLGTACRIGELLKARWENVNLESGEWFVPKADTKTKANDWTVYLSGFALRKFRALHDLSGNTPWCFPARTIEGGDANDHVCEKTVSKQVGDRQMKFKKRSGPLKHRRHDNSLVLTKGPNEAWTPHDMRRTAATMMQALGVTPEVIDECQNHAQAGSKVRRHYMHYDYAAEKRSAWRLLGERLDIILDNANVIALPARSA